MKNIHILNLTKILVSKSIHLVNLGLHHLEILNSNYSEQEMLPYPPIFIIGAPRSGSTLLYQVLTNYYDVGYLSNLHARFYGSPSIIERFFHPLKSRQSSDYTSYHGRTEGWLDPSECGEFWYRFFRRKPQYVPLDEADPNKIRQLRGAVRSLVDAFGKPILFKNLNCALRLEPLAKALPESLFIVIHRELLDNSHSLLEGRKKLYGNYTTWWSMEPPAIDKLKTLPPHQQVMEQIRHIYTLIERDRKIIGSNRFIDLQYEEFCRDTYCTINRLDIFFRSHGVNLKKLPQLSIPPNFQRRNQIRIDRALYSELTNYTHELEKYR